MSKIADCRRCDQLETVPHKGLRCRRGGGFIEPEDLGPLSDMETGGRLCKFDGPFGDTALEEQTQPREVDPMPRRTILDEVVDGRAIRDLIREAYEGPKDAQQVARELCELTGLVVTAQQVASSWGHMGPRQPRKPRAKREPAAAPAAKSTEKSLAEINPGNQLAPQSTERATAGQVVAFARACAQSPGREPTEADWWAFRAGWEAALEVTA